MLAGCKQVQAKTLMPPTHYAHSPSVHWLDVAAAFGDSRTAAALKAHLKQDLKNHPEGLHIHPNKRYGMAEDEFLLQLMDKSLKSTAAGKLHIDWAAVEAGMHSRGYSHSVAGLRSHAARLKAQGV